MSPNRMHPELTTHFAAADHWGGFAVGLIVLLTAFHIVRDTSDELMDAMPNDERIARIRQVALSAPGVLGVEKTYARKTGLQPGRFFAVGYSFRIDNLWNR